MRSRRDGAVGSTGDGQDEVDGVVVDLPDSLMPVTTQTKFLRPLLMRPKEKITSSAVKGEPSAN